MKVPDLFVGKRLFVGCANPPAIALGIGPSEIRGSAYLEGPVMVGTPLSYSTGPNVTEANLMVARCGNLEALPPPPSIFKVSTRGLPPTPIDIMLGDPTGHVGIAVNSLVISIFNDTNISIISPFTTGVGVLNWVGAKTLTGVVAENGAEARAGAEVVSAATVDNGSKNIHGALTVVGSVSAAGQVSAPSFLGDISKCSGKKNFDIPHPTKDGWRLRHVCIEGPTADVYVKGKLNDSNAIQLPEYWKKLVDPESITVNLTPIGNYQELFVEKIEWGTKIIIKNNSGSSVNCYYTVYGERIDTDKNIAEYEGTYDDYPGDNSQYTQSAIVNK
jgi:hypothetical protein